MILLAVSVAEPVLQVVEPIAGALGISADVHDRAAFSPYEHNNSEKTATQV